MADDAIPLYGLDKELAAKAAAKYDPQREIDARYFIETVTNETFPSNDFQESLKDGVLLCKVMNALQPDEKPIKISPSKMPFKQMENISSFLDRMAAYGVPAHDRFLTVDLFEGKNINQVIDSIFALSRTANRNGANAPLLGPKLATKATRTFSEDQLLASKAAVPKLQAFNSGATQKGISFGSVRQVYNPSIGTGDTSVTTKFLSSKAKAEGGPLGSFGGRREIGGIYLDGPVDQEGNVAAEAAESVDVVISKVEALEVSPDDILDSYVDDEEEEVVVIDE
ncbi:calponin domain-containing protein [Polychytrium aggregatum]|uniref:calponin domain-containing protein n=1 Tax=Polychytrium aggregatum TaxID=110093 RepID=UPI0022FE7C86|nr:calponin domain-containing protein [Polychytrium aggregatum]KAI9202255.1 calponin homology domain-containing protein [Polychytrium aggregatum]